MWKIPGSYKGSHPNGQTCISANRFLVQEGIYPAFVDKLKAVVEKLVIGDGKKDGVNLGPLINEAQFKKVSEIVEDAMSKGATVLLGGRAKSDVGKLFFEPTIITDVTPNMRMYNEEIFGPVVSLIKFNTEEEALTVANNTNSGLAGYFYSEDVSQIFRVAKKIETGMVGINESAISCTEAAFGGIKESGLGHLDGGFFEKFGSLLRQKSIHDEEKMATPLAPLPEVAEEAVAEEAVALEARLLGEEGENDSGNETLHDTDSEPEDAEVKSLEFVEDAVGWNE
uniref:Aldehyde dehydrogenase domain-containing protein n=1 Tax=Phlebotomus papatasi TaxID=29031 RepID=A0A1B0GPE7_PHLPP